MNRPICGSLTAMIHIFVHECPKNTEKGLVFTRFCTKTIAFPLLLPRTMEEWSGKASPFAMHLAKNAPTMPPFQGDKVVVCIHVREAQWQGGLYETRSGYQ